jgi:hypothetical protein
MTNRQALFLVVAVNLLKGQQSETAKPIEPDLLGVVFYLSSSDHIIRALPKEQWKAVGKAKAGWSSVNSVGSLQLSGAASSFRVPVSDTSEFVFKVSKDPESAKLFMCSQNAKKGFRQVDIVEEKRSAHPFGRATVTKEHLSGVPVEVVKYGESSYKLAARGLAPGEYAILSGGAVFSFGIQ